MKKIVLGIMIFSLLVADENFTLKNDMVTLEDKEQKSCDKCQYRYGLYKGVRKELENDCLICLKSKKYKLSNIVMYSYVLSDDKRYEEDIKLLTEALKRYKENKRLKIKLAESYTFLKKLNKALKLRESMLYSSDKNFLLDLSNYINYMELRLLLDKPLNKQAYSYTIEYIKKFKSLGSTDKILFEILQNIYRVLDKEKPIYKIKRISTYEKEQFKKNASSDMEYIDTWIKTKPKNFQASLNRILLHYQDMLAIKRGKIIDKKGNILAQGSGEDRVYPEKGMTVHMVGFASFSKKTESIIGKTGLEKEYEDDLKNNQDIVLNMDLELQKKIIELFRDKSGVAIVMKTDGAILSALSLPTYNPNLFVKGISKKEWRRLITDLEHPFSNKISSTVYSPASTVKMGVTLALGNSKNVDKNITCKALKLDIDTIAKGLNQMGLGVKTGIDLPCERKAIVPTKAWKLKRFNQPWHKEETVMASIGQGYTTVTPIQLARYTAFLASGKLPTPHVAYKIGKKEIKPKYTEVEETNQSILEEVRKGMYDVCNKENGTANGVFSKLSIKVAGKTGTIPILYLPQSEEKRMIKEEKIHYKLSHKVMVSYAPYDKPKYVVVVLVEHDEANESSAMVISSKIHEWMEGNYDVNESKESILSEKKSDSCAMCRQAFTNFTNRDKYEKFCSPCLESKKDKKIHDIIYSGILIKEKKFKEGIAFLTKLLATKYKDDMVFINDLAYLFNKIGEYNKAYKLRKTLLYRDVYLFENTNYVDYLELELILNKQLDKKAHDYYGQKFKKETIVAQKLTFEMLDNLIRIQNNQEVLYEIEKVEMSVKNQYENHVPSNLSHLKKWIKTKSKGMQLKLEAVLVHYDDLMK